MSELFAVGLGPGSREGMTFEAYEAIKNCDVIAGYTKYIELVPEEFKDKEILSTGMRGEVERCRMALEAAAKGKTVAMVCSGDSGLYGMSALLHELAPQYEGVTIKTICGVTAALSGSARLGAPIGEDFATISLSNYNVTQEMIDKRLAALAQVDMNMVFYNPVSKSRPETLHNAIDILRQYMPGDRPCGIVRNIGRPGETAVAMTLDELYEYPCDMFTAVFIGNSKTYVQDGKLVTPRGYKHD